MINALDTSPLTAANFLFVRELVRREAAIVIEKGKEYLVETRLAPVAMRESLASVNALVDILRVVGAGNPQLLSAVIDALTTNETLFFRDLNPFDSLRDHVIPKLRASHPAAPLSIWSAACSSGQEAYSIAMLLAESFPGLSSRILGTDISTTIIKRAAAGRYDQLEVNRGLPAKYLVKYFRQDTGGWQLDERIRRQVEFRSINLAGPWTGLPRFHLVFLRNVMIYFDLETRRQILRRVREVLAPGGFLVLGSAETTVMVDPDYVPVTLGKATFYQIGPAR